MVRYAFPGAAAVLMRSALLLSAAAASRAPAPRLAPPARGRGLRATTDLSGDGLVVKTSTAGGDGAPAFDEDGAVALLTYTARAASGQLLDEGVQQQCRGGAEISLSA